MNMQIIVKGLKNFEVFPENKEYIQKKFSKYEKLIKEPATLEFKLDHTHNTRANLDKKVILSFTMPGLKESEYLEEINEHFTTSIDKLAERFEEILRRHRDKALDPRL